MTLLTIVFRVVWCVNSVHRFSHWHIWQLSLREKEERWWFSKVTNRVIRRLFLQSPITFFSCCCFYFLYKKMTSGGIVAIYIWSYIVFCEKKKKKCVVQLVSYAVLLRIHFINKRFMYYHRNSSKSYFVLLYFLYSHNNKNMSHILISSIFFRIRIYIREI